MKYILDILILVVGFVLLIKGADWFVDGSAALAKNFKVPGVIVGLTIVALGTSAPELAVSTVAAIQGSNEIALSNVVGSNIFNLMVVLGVCAVIHKVPVDRSILKRDFPFSIIITVMILFMTSYKVVFSDKLFSPSGMLEDAGKAARWIGIILLVLFVSYITVLIVDARRHPENEEISDLLSIGKCIGLIILGIAMIVGGGEAVVRSAKSIAKAAGMSETLIGLTIVAVGTSLPELVTSIVAARKGETGLAVGNVIGSNIFNLLFILGVSSTIHPIAVNYASVYDLIILIVFSIIVYIISYSKKTIGRFAGILMLGLYIGDVVFAALR